MDQITSPQPFISSTNPASLADNLGLTLNTCQISNVMNALPFKSDVFAEKERLLEEVRWLYTSVLHSAQMANKYYKAVGVNWKNPALYKTSLCDSFRIGKPCKYGAKCWYAHGFNELRYVPRLDLIPTLLESLKSENTSPGFQDVQNLMVTNSDLPVELYMAIQPPKADKNRCVMPSQLLQTIAVKPVMEKTMSSSVVSEGELPNRKLSSPCYQDTVANAKEVQSIPGILTSTDTDSVTGSWFSGLLDHATSTMNNKIASSFKPSIWEDSAVADDKSEFNNNLCEESTSSRATFTGSFNPFSQDYQLQNWF